MNPNRRLLRSSLLLLGLALPAVPGATQDAGPSPRRLDPAQMEEDLFALSEELTTQHGGLLRYRSQEEMDELFGRILFEVGEEEHTVLEFYRLVAELISRIGCGHTGVRLATVDETVALSRRGLLPLEVLLRGERVFVRRTLVDGLALEPGDEILSIDGRPVAEIRALAFSRLPGDGFIETGKQRRLERDFARLLGLLVDDRASGPFRLELAGRATPVELAGIPPREHGAARTRSAARPVVALEILEQPTLGLLTVSTFGDPGGPEPSFPELLARSFEELRGAGVKNLVLDLRGNGGGVDMYGALLVSYLSPESFGYFDRIEVTEEYAQEGETIHRDGMRLVLSHRGLDVQEPAPDRFDGCVYVLIDGWTFSTAADVAMVAHHNELATFVGEETGGGYDGNTSGVSGGIGLVHSGFGVNVPRWMYTTANVGHEFPGRGVIPDQRVPGTVEEALAGTDPQLEYVRRLVLGE